MKNISNGRGRLAASAAVILLALMLAACQPGTKQAMTPTAAATATITVEPTEAPYVLEGATTTATGLQYLEITAGTGPAPKVGDLITMHYIATLADGTELANSYTQGDPVVSVWGPNRLLTGWEEGIGLMKQGGKAKMVLPPELAFGPEGSGSIPPNAQIVIEMELLTVSAPPTPAEVANADLTKTETGLQYYDLTEGNGEEAIKSSTVSTLYTIWVKTDSGYDYIDASQENSPASFVIGRGDTVFPGWEEGVTGMKVGGKRLLVIPPELAYGESGAGTVIPGNATLVMEIELVSSQEPRVATKVDEKDFTTTESGLKYYDLVEGTGATPTTGQTVVVHYTGWLEDGTQFDSSVDRGQPFSFALGTGGVIAGWDEGVATMKVGGKRQLVIPAALGYGDSGAGGLIPPGATLIFEVELLEIQGAE
jgi:peptidylprolyl isomerase